jgi:Tetracyclin repressor-like, C-terminal domain
VARLAPHPAASAASATRSGRSGTERSAPEAARRTQRITACREDLDTVEKVRAIIVAGVRRQAEHTARLQLLIRSEADLPEDIAAKHAASRRSVLKSLTEVIEAGIAPTASSGRSIPG